MLFILKLFRCKKELNGVMGLDRKQGKIFPLDMT